MNRIPFPQPLRTIWLDENQRLFVIDQTRLPHEETVVELRSLEDVYQVIVQMIVRGAPLIGVTAAYGMWFAAKEANELEPQMDLLSACHKLKDSRPTAVNLFICLDRVMEAIQTCTNKEEYIQTTLQIANQLVEEDIEICYQIGRAGLPLIETISKQKGGQTVHILTHCNAGMMGCIQWGTISSPIYQALDKGIDLHVWVDETRPRNQGANLTAWELERHKVPHTLIVDNTCGHLMQHKMVDLVLVGTDRTTRKGDVANKIGTYLKALAAKDNQIPFYVALPSTTIDWNIYDGIQEIPIEERNPDEVRFVYGLNSNHQFDKVRICPENTGAKNYGFDVTPARLVTGLITERGICKAEESDMLRLFPEMIK